MVSETSEAHNPYLNGNIPAEIAENLRELFPEDEDISHDEFLVQQEIVYLAIQAYGQNSNLTPGQTSDKSAQVGESSHHVGVESQVELDELLARSLELGEDLECFNISEYSGTAAESIDAPPQSIPLATPQAMPQATPEATPQATPVRGASQNIREDEIDPDNMTYEELQSLSEAVGHESRGLSDEVISRLPRYKYKTGFFSKKRTKEECVICYAEYASGDRLIALPCTHQYHSHCITRWLKLNKSCPICKEEVKDT